MAERQPCLKSEKDQVSKQHDGDHTYARQPKGDEIKSEKQARSSREETIRPEVAKKRNHDRSIKCNEYAEWETCEEKNLSREAIKMAKYKISKAERQTIGDENKIEKSAKRARENMAKTNMAKINMAERQQCRKAEREMIQAKMADQRLRKIS